MITKEKKDLAADILRKKAEEIGRIPLKNDFDDVTVSKIKAYLGPWPRALEYARLKEPKTKVKKSKKRKSKITSASLPNYHTSMYKKDGSQE